MYFFFLLFLFENSPVLITVNSIHDKDRGKIILHQSSEDKPENCYICTLAGMRTGPLGCLHRPLSCAYCIFYPRHKLN